MKQVIMNYRTGNVELAEVPKPRLKSGGIIVRNLYSAISVGTESLMVKTGKSSLLKKAKNRPDLVKKVIDKLKTEGLAETYKQVVNRLDEPIPLGYSCAGIVEEVARDVNEFKVGDLVACFGSGYASHANYVWVPKNLAVPIPDNMSLSDASFAGIASISLHAIRLSGVSLGDSVAVYGLGLLGLIAVQILKAMGCKVLGIDIDEVKLNLAKKLGCDFVANGYDSADMFEKSKNISNSFGVDSVILFVSSGSSDVLYNAANMARDKAKIVATGVLELEVPRKDFFEKELEFVVSRGAGAGIFDENYELKGFDYPIGYVKWTEKRNMEEILELIKNGKLNIEKLITHKFKIEEAANIYDKLVENELKVIGAVFEYGDTRNKKENETLVKVTKNFGVKPLNSNKNYLTLGVIGAGLFAKTTLFPILKKIQKKGKVRLKYVATTSGTTSYHAAKRYGFEYATSDYKKILEDKEVDAVMILTQHNSHARFVVEALEAEKHVFVEKPLALTVEQLSMINEVHKKHPDRIIMVGFNRRFSPHARFIKKHSENAEGPFVVLCRVNAGYVDELSWVLDPEKGGGRIVGEACHFIDLIQYLTGELPTAISVETIDEKNGYFKNDNVIITIKLDKGSIGTIVYYANGHKRFPRELVEISGNGMNGKIDNFVRSTFVGGSKSKKFKTFGVDRGHNDEMEVFVNACLKGKVPVLFEELYQISLVSIVGESLPNSKVSVVQQNV